MTSDQKQGTPPGATPGASSDGDEGEADNQKQAAVVPTEGSETEGSKSTATGAPNPGTPTVTEGSPSGHPDELD